MDKNFKFVNLNTYTKTDMIYKPEKRLDTYYQVCQFKNPYTKKYSTRKVVFNEYGEILKMYEKEYESKELKEFMRHHKRNKFKLFPTNDIKLVDLPNSSDMVQVQSELLNNNCKEYGYDSI